MKKVYTLLLLSLVLFSCKKVAGPLVPKVEFYEIATTMNTATIKGFYEHNFEPENIVIIYAESSDMISSISEKMNVVVNDFNITLTGLKSNTKYYFKLRFASDFNYYETEQQTFYTSDEDNPDEPEEPDGPDNPDEPEEPDIPDNPVNTETITVKGVSFVMVEVEGGTFAMGGSGVGSNIDESPIHDVSLDTYFIGETEVTQSLWKAVMGDNPSHNVGDDKPVDNISWDMAQEFVEKINYLSGKTFRLPTEAEWEYAARGGSHTDNYKYSGGNSVNNVAWYEDNSSYASHNVKTKIPNELGVYDMSGNVFEWCSDWYGGYNSSAQTNPVGPETGNNKVVRGGSFSYSDSYCRVTDRFSATPSWSDVCYGFRLVMEK